jgi:hypothetical protein
MTKTRVKIISFSVLHNAISVRLLCENPESLVNEARDEKRRVGLDDLSFEARIRSISIQREGANVLLRIKKNRFFVGRLFDLMGREVLELSISPSFDGKISYLLSKVSKKLGKSEEEILLRLTTFQDREGKEIMGKRSVENLSEAQKGVVLRKLDAILREEGASFSNF